MLLFIFREYLTGSFEGSIDRLFSLLYSLGPNLTDETVVMLLDGYERENICLPRFVTISLLWFTSIERGSILMTAILNGLMP